MTLWNCEYVEKQKKVKIIFVDKSRLLRQSSRKTRDRALKTASTKKINSHKFSTKSIFQKVCLNVYGEP